MRLCFVAHPNSIHVRRWLDYFARRGHDVHLLTYFQNVALTGVTTHSILPAFLHGLKHGRERFAVLVAPWYTRRLVRALKPDLVHAHYAAFNGWIASFAGFHPLILTLWGGDIMPDQGAFRFPKNWLTPLALQRADLVTAVSPRLLSVAEQFTKPGVGAYIIRIGADLNFFTPWVDGSQWRDKMRLTGRPIILCPRPIAPVYNIRTVIAAMPYVLKQIPDACLVLKDNDSTIAPAYRAQVERMVIETGVQKAVCYVGDVPFEEMPAIYRSADVVVSVALSEGFPVSVFEAMACGVPMVLGRIPQLEELIADGKNALFVPVQDPKSLAESIVRLLKDQPLREKMIAANLALVKEYGNFDVEMGKMQVLYASVTSLAAKGG